MDIASLLTVLLLALALAVQPWSVLAAVLLVTSTGGVTKAVAYAAGWVVALAIVTTATLTLYPETPQVASTSPLLNWLQLAAGVSLGCWLLLRSRRPVMTTSNAQPPGAPPGTTPPRTTPPRSAQPRWMARLDEMSPLTAFVLGAFLPNYVMVVAAVGNALQAGLTKVGAAIVMVLFIVVASAGVAGPLLVPVIRPDQAPDIYQSWRAWLIAHGQALLRVVLAVVAVVLMSKGLVGLVA